MRYLLVGYGEMVQLPNDAAPADELRNAYNVFMKAYRNGIHDEYLTLKDWLIKYADAVEDKEVERLKEDC